MADKTQGDVSEARGTTRRSFLTQLAAAGGSLLASEVIARAQLLRPLTVDNPLAGYPNRGWEKVYRNLYKHDSSFVFGCAPNDTHNCLLRAYVKNGVVTRIAPSYAYHKATDLDGRKATARWDPRCCQKGLALARRFYGDRRCKKPMVRKGLRDWAAAGYPRDPATGAVDLMWLNRGRDEWVAVSWDEAFDLVGRTLIDIAKAYQGPEGQAKLAAQGYDPEMVEATRGAGTQVLKFRGGMPALGMTRIFAQYRLANSMALLDDTLRGTGPEKAIGARGFDNYAWHTDLPPGHPMVTGVNTIDFDLCNVEHAGLVILWGMNWIATKMPDSHWLTEARMKGTKIVLISCEYSATANKADELLIVRPGMTPALALAFAQVIVSEKLYDEAWVKQRTDLPFLIRMDTGKLLRASEVVAGWAKGPLTNSATVLSGGRAAPPMHEASGPVFTEAQRDDWGEYVMWDERTGKPIAVTRDQIGKHFAALAVDPALDGERRVTLLSGETVVCRTVFDVTREMLDSSYTPEEVSKLTWAPAEGIRSIARQIAENRGKTLIACGIAPNQYFNSDLKDRAILLVASLTANLGTHSGNVGSYSGNHRAAYLNGVVQWIQEDPFNPELDPTRPAPVKPYFTSESAHYFNHGDSVLRMGKTLLTGKTHMPTPTKSILVSNSNSLIGNVKGHYETVFNTFKRIELVVVSEWWWTASCEYADVVFPVDSWAELRYPDLTISVTNPFIQTFPVSPLPRIHDTKSDVDVAAGVGRAIGRATEDSRHEAYWKFVEDGQMRPYLQRILDHSNNARGYQIEDMEAKAADGTPVIMQSRTYPKVAGWEHTNEDRPWYTKSGRLEFYREEDEFKDSGERVIVHREPIDSTFHEPNVIVAKPHPLLSPKGPEAYGVKSSDQSGDVRQARHVVRTVDEVMASSHPLMHEGFRFIFHTPKYRHGAHTTPVDVDVVAAWFGPFGDMLREDRRSPFITEMYVDMNPLDGKDIGVEDGDYVWIDADPEDRPFKGWQKDPENYKVARLLCRARYYPGTPRGVTRMWHNAYGATVGSVRGAEVNANGMAKNPATNYQAMFRRGSHQSCTRGWIKPTWMTDSLNAKSLLTQKIKAGWEPDVHGPTGAPREAFVKITKAEPGGIDGQPLWRPAALGLRPGYENPTLKTLIAGGFVSVG